MPLRFFPGDRIDSLFINQLLAGDSGTGWLGGGEVSIVPDSADPIELNVESASVRIDNSDPINVAADTVTIPDGDAQWDRRDILYADVNGQLKIETGQPQPQKPDGVSVEPKTETTDSTDRMAQLSQPVPPDVLRMNGVPLWEIFVPARAQSAKGLTALDGRELRDRRRESAVDQLESSSHSSLSDLLADDHPQYLPVNGTRKADSSIIGGGKDGQVVTSDGSDSQWNSPSFVYQLSPTTLEASGNPNNTLTEYVYCPNGVTILALGVADENGDPQTAVQTTVDVLDSSADPITTTDRNRSVYLLYESATKVAFSMTNISASSAGASAELWFRRHAPF